MANIFISWTPADLVNSESQVVEYKLATSSVWLIAGIVNSRADNYIITGIDKDKTYHVRIGNKCKGSENNIYGPIIVVENNETYPYKWIIDDSISYCEYGNDEITGTAIKNDCPEGEEGSTVTYTVEENTYFADTQLEADQLALADFNSNKQTYANENGTCTEIPPFYFSSNSSGTYGATMTTPYCSSGGGQEISPGVTCGSRIKWQRNLPNNLNVTDLTNGAATQRSWNSSGNMIVIPSDGTYRVYIRILGSIVIPNIGGGANHFQNISFFLRKNTSYTNLIAPGQNSAYGSNATEYCSSFNPIGLYQTQYVGYKGMSIPLDISFNQNLNLITSDTLAAELWIWESCYFNQQQGANETNTTQFIFSSMIIEIEKIS